MDEVNGCDYWWDGNWKQCCDIHDVAFQQGGEITDFLYSNWELFTCVVVINPLMAFLMFLGVSVLGVFTFRFKVFKGKTLFEIITGKKYEGG